MHVCRGVSPNGPATAADSTVSVVSRRSVGTHSKVWDGPNLVHEEICNATDARSRLEAGVQCVQRGGSLAGQTKCSTASNVRPTVLDYHFAYTHGEFRRLQPCL